MANGLLRPDFDAPPNLPNDDSAGDDGMGGEPWMGVLVPTVIVAVSALVVAGLIDRVAGRSDPEQSVVANSAPDRDDGGTAGHADEADATTVSPDPTSEGFAGLIGEPMASVLIHPGRSTGSSPTGMTAAGAPEVGSITSTHRHRVRTTTSTGTKEPAPPAADSTRLPRTLTIRPAPASTAAPGTSASIGAPGLTSTTAESVAVDTNERYRRFVADADLDDVDFITRYLAHGTRVSGDQRINVMILDHLRTAGIRVSPGGRAPVPIGAWAAEIGAQAAINANWFSAGRGFDGPFVAEGAVYGGPDHHYTALFGFTADKRLVTEHHSVVNDTVDQKVVEAVAGHPTLIDRGRVTTDFGNDPTFTRRHPRTAIGAAYGGDIVVFVTVDGRSLRARGMTGAETATLMADLGATHAVMLDGGGSSAMWIEGRGVVNGQSDPGRRLGNQIAIFGR